MIGFEFLADMIGFATTKKSGAHCVHGHDPELDMIKQTLQNL